MPNRNRRPRKECVYCGSRQNLTRDHVPPRCLFATPPQNAITVPCCQKCNQEASKDDEYFRSNLSGRRDVGDHPEASKVMEKSFRALHYPEAKGLKRSFLNNVDFFYYVNELGFIEPGASYSPDLERLGRVASRIVKGLYWHKTNERLPDHYEVDAGVVDQLRQFDEQLTNMCAEVLKEEPLALGNDVFKCWHKSTPEDRFSSLWILQFYTNIHFLCVTTNSYANQNPTPPKPILRPNPPNQNPSRTVTDQTHHNHENQTRRPRNSL